MTGTPTTSTPAAPAPRRARRQLVGLLAVVAFALAACGTSPGHRGTSASAADRPPATEVHVVIEHFAFHPDTVTVAPGATVTVSNRDGVTHTFTARDGVFSTGDIAPGRTATVTAPTRPGTYPFLCLIHQYMTGTLVVRPG